MKDSDEEENRGMWKAGWTPLHVAARFNDVESAKLLIKYGADIEAENNVILHLVYSVLLSTTCRTTKHLCILR